MENSTFERTVAIGGSNARHVNCSELVQFSIPLSLAFLPDIVLSAKYRPLTTLGRQHCRGVSIIPLNTIEAMRLLHTFSGRFVELEESLEQIRYAILSHTWNRKEQTYQDVREIQKSYESATVLQGAFQHPARYMPANLQSDSVHLFGSIWEDPRLSPKIRNAAQFALQSGYKFIWIDSCCIDKTSSAELSEAINSMYQWYGHATVCYAYLSDVQFAERSQLEAKFSDFRKSRWFKRGWTLQELIAPPYLTFLSRDWRDIGTKHVLSALVEEITSIPKKALLHMASLDEFSVAQRFSWAAGRETKRVEDKAYSLLGIFDINMYTLYGEGSRAFRRLQEEILRRIPDQSIFVWRRLSPIHQLKLQVDACRLEMENKFSNGIMAAMHSAPTTTHAQPQNGYFLRERSPQLMEIRRSLDECHRQLDMLRLEPEGCEGSPDFELYKHALELVSKRINKLNNEFNHLYHNFHDTLNVAISGSMFANSPLDFFWGGSHNIRASSHVELSQRLGQRLPPPEYTFTPHGIRTVLPLIPLSLCVAHFTGHHIESPPYQWYLVILSCKLDEYPDQVVGLVCYIPLSETGAPTLHCSSVRTKPDECESLFLLSPHTIAACHRAIQLKTVYIPHGSGRIQLAPHPRKRSRPLFPRRLFSV